MNDIEQKILMIFPCLASVTVHPGLSHDPVTFTLVPESPRFQAMTFPKISLAPGSKCHTCESANLLNLVDPAASSSSHVKSDSRTHHWKGKKDLSFSQVEIWNWPFPGKFLQATSHSDILSFKNHATWLFHQSIL